MSKEAENKDRVSALERYGLPYMNLDTDRDKYAAGLVDMWVTADVDYTITVSFSEEVYNRLGLKSPERMKAFVKERLAAAGYFGPYVLVVHDKNGTSYWHPHLIIKDNGTAKRIEREFFKYGDLGRASNGPIQGSGSFAYHARRATELWPLTENWDFEPGWRRRPRPRGRGVKRKAVA